ncbi:MAG TPA: GtrA family protein [Pseudonocardiaceae bacterium]|nr:GtrA family protein [Pseudonocardiaceae bacterium]
MTRRVSRPLADRFGALMSGSVRLMPAWLRRAVPADMVGYLVLGVVTFAVDVVLLVLLDRLTPLPLPVCVVTADTLAWALHFQLNRTLNFRSRAPAGPQALRYGVVVCGCLAISAGVTSGVAELGAHLAVARLVAGGCIAACGYVACRWWVFHPPARTFV